MGLAMSHINSVVFLVLDMLYLGMMEFASAIIEPIGDDHNDFPLVFWLQEFLCQSNIMLEYSLEQVAGIEKWQSVLGKHTNPIFLQTNKLSKPF